MRSTIAQRIIDSTPERVKDHVRYLGARQYLCGLLMKYDKTDFRVRELVKVTGVAQRTYNKHLAHALPG